MAENKEPILKKMFALHIREVKGYFKRMVAVKPADVKAFDERIDKTGDKREVRSQDDIAIIPIRGFITPIFDFWCWLFGGIAVENLEAQIDAALNDSTIKGIILDIDSPGGDIGGVNDLANKIFDARGQGKPIISYVSDLAASAGYWIGSAAEKLIAGEVALLGSIGIVASFMNDESDEVNFFSSVSPKKDIDPNEPEGARSIQQWVDDIGKVFVSRVAVFRGVVPDVVIKKFGQGDVMIAGNALQAGMIDRVGNFKMALQLAKGELEQVEEPAANGGRATALAINKPKGKIKTMKNKIYLVKRKGGLSAELVIVDDDNPDAVIPDDAIALVDIDIPFLEENLPELVEEIRQQGRDEENARQEEMDDMDEDVVTDDEEAKMDDDNGARAILRRARRDTKIKSSDIALQLMKSFKGKQTKQTSKDPATSYREVPPIPPSNGKTAQTQKEKDRAEFKSGAQKAKKKKSKVGVL